MNRLLAFVSGGAGFLGSYVCERLVQEGKHVVCLDNLQTGRRQNIAHLAGAENFEFIEADIRDGAPDRRFSEIWNLACPASPPRYQADPIGTMMTNVLGAQACLENARKYGGRVLQASTSEVYGDAEINPQPETYRGAVNPVGPRACYDEGKRAAETLCFDYYRVHGVAMTVVRIFNTYGPRMDPGDGRVVSNFIVNALRGAPLELYGDGAQTRSLCYVDDLIDGLFRAMRAPQPFLGPVNIGNPAEYTIRALAELVREMIAPELVFVAKPMPTDDPQRRRPDITLARTALNWEPTIPLRAGLLQTIAYFKEQMRLRPGSARPEMGT